MDKSIFLEESAYTDVALVVEDTKLHVSKTVLSLVSPVFRQMFESDFKEKDKTEIPLPEKKLSDVVEFLNAIYPTILRPIQASTVFLILPLADEYQIENLKSRCAEHMIKMCRCSTEDLSVDTLLQILTNADKYDLSEVLNAALVVASRRRLRDIESKAMYEVISDKTKLRISSERQRELESILFGDPFLSNLEKLNNFEKCKECKYGKPQQEPEAKQRHHGYGPREPPAPTPTCCRLSSRQKEAVEALLLYGFRCTPRSLSTTMKYLDFAKTTGCTGAERYIISTLE